ncbi:hypothetical protein LB535_20405 [Mesorhizobium sp. CA10]|uniref:hypothetical protein n=1 Tax=Mesorhizobium sp. CA10 TaxID=588495 RepID=UPI001CCFE977|nr:hypothetical protein [Mesorhizobium sp. CA10]MBZ9884713.1 hypothetical protein [Mesorhizobium sp. CA10]
MDIPIGKSQYDQIKDAIQRIISATDAEELYLVCVYNYEDYERHLLTSALDDMIFSKDQHSEFLSIIGRTHQRLANFLTSCRAYLDQIQTLADRVCTKSTGADDRIRELASAWYDRSLSYRLMEALRNFVQHRGFGVHGLALGRRWVAKGDDIKHRAHHWVQPNVSPVRLSESGSFKRSVLDEIVHLKSVDLNPHVREYMRAISEVQALFRTETANDIREAEQPVRWALDKYRAESSDGKTIGASAVAYEGGNVVDEYPILQETLDYYAETKNRVSSFANLERRVVSNAPPP